MDGHVHMLISIPPEYPVSADSMKKLSVIISAIRRRKTGG